MTGVALLDAQVVAVLEWLVRTSADAAVIALLVLLVQMVFARWLTPAWRYRLWGLVVLRLLMPALPASPASLWNLDRLMPARNTMGSATNFAPAGLARSSPPLVTPVYLPEPSPPNQVRITFVPQPLALRTTVAPKASQEDRSAPPRPRNLLPLVLMAIWLTGSALLLARLISTNLVLARRLRRSLPVNDPRLLARLSECCGAIGIRHPPSLLVTDAVGAPATAGVWRPLLLVPPGLLDLLSAAEQRAVLTHELAHVRCRDVAVNWATALLQIVHWFNPVIWLAFARLRADREVARDAMVLRLSGGDDAAGAADRYVEILLRLTERLSRGTTPVTVAGIVTVPAFNLIPGLFGTRRGLQRRLHMITRSDTAVGRFTIAGPALAIALACCTLTGKTTPRPAEPAAALSTQPATPEELISRQVAQTKRLAGQGKYREALAVVEQILAHDPDNDYAVGIRPLLADKAAAEYRLAESRRVADLNEPAERPVVEDKAALAEEQRVKQATQKLLDRTIKEASFESVAFSDVIDYLRDVSGANIFVNWKSLESAGVDPKTPITARLRDIKLSKALNVLLDGASGGSGKLGYAVDAGVITITTTDDLAKNVVVRVYDIRDLLVIAPDFQMNEPATAIAAPGPATHPSAPTTRPAPTREELVKQIIRLIEETIDTKSWKDHGGKAGAVRELQGQLIVTQTPENHRSLVTLLEQLRESRSIQVFVQARYIACDEQVVKALIAKWQQAAGPTTRPAGQPAIDIFLDQAQVDQFLRATRSDPQSAVLAAPRITLFNGQRAGVVVATERAYISDYAMVRNAAGETRYEPVRDVVEPGLVVDVAATVSADRKFVSLTLRPKVSALLEMKQVPWPSRPPGSNLMIGQPLMKVSELQTTASIPNDRTLLLGGLEDPGIAADEHKATATAPATAPAGHLRGLFLLVKPAIIIQPPGEQKGFPLLQKKDAQ